MPNRLLITIKSQKYFTSVTSHVAEPPPITLCQTPSDATHSGATFFNGPKVPIHLLQAYFVKIMPFRDPLGPRNVKRGNQNSIYFGVLIDHLGGVFHRHIIHTVTARRQCLPATDMLLLF